MASTLAQRYKEQITRPIHRTKALKGEKQEDHFQDVVGVSFRCRSGKRRFLQTVLKSRQEILSYLAVTKKNSLWTISTSSWAHCHGNVPKRESQMPVCV